MAVNRKKIRERVTRMNTAWAQGAPDVKFKGIKREDFDAEIKSAATTEQEYDDLLAQAKMKANELDAIYQGLNDNSVKIRDGVEGDENFGPNHPIYEAMGFVLESERKSGLTRKKNKPAN